MADEAARHDPRQALSGAIGAERAATLMEQLHPVAEVTGWPSVDEELRAFEGIHLGDEEAFRAVAAPLQPHLRRLAAIHVAGSRTDEVVRRSWATALAGHGMFRWQTPLATWVAGFVGASARGERTVRPPPRRAVPITPPSAPAAGPSDWSDLPWSARWRDVGLRLEAALADLPAAEREVVHGVEAGWQQRRVCDVFGLTAAAHDRLLASAHDRLHLAVAAHLAGDQPTCADEAAQVTAVTRWLRQRVDVPRREPLDPETLEVFRTWAASRHRRWPRVLPRRVSRRAAAPAARRDAPASGTASARPTPT